jgi:hypothetical protein
MQAAGVAGACVVRDAVDMVPYLCGHYLRAGFAHLAFVDDGSSDGTFEFLQTIARRTRRVSVRRVRNETYRQRELMSDAANALIASGYSIVVPFDADEFWNADADMFVRIAESAPEGVFPGDWVCFVQSRDRLESVRLGPLGMRFRAPALEAADQKGVTGLTHAFVCHKAQKLAFKSREPVEISQGQHAMLEGPAHRFGPPMQIFHLPFRSRHEIVKRGLDFEPRRAPLRPDPSASWQSAWHRDMVLAGKVEAVWAANSFDEQGRLDVYGKPLDLVRDDSLRRLLIEAALYLRAVYGLRLSDPR